MSRTGGEKTRARILAVAEKLFGEKGFDATSVDEIARSAGVNKALIYYHFKNKRDLILKLFESIVEELTEHVNADPRGAVPDSNASIRRQLEGELEFLHGRKRIIAIMLGEALKSGRRDDLLFRCAEIVARAEHGEDFVKKGRGVNERAAQRRMVGEFFTGFVPIVLFVALRDRWCGHHGYDPQKATEDFIDAFERSHLASHTTSDHRGGR